VTRPATDADLPALLRVARMARTVIDTRRRWLATRSTEDRRVMEDWERRLDQALADVQAVTS
jgi:hypothetical protein